LDLYCDGGAVDQDDLTVLTSHLGHACNCPVPARASMI
jgi:hypothetical protein